METGNTYTGKVKALTALGLGLGVVVTLSVSEEGAVTYVTKSGKRGRASMEQALTTFKVVKREFFARVNSCDLRAYDLTQDKPVHLEIGTLVIVTEYFNYTPKVESVAKPGIVLELMSDNPLTTVVELRGDELC